MLALWYNDCHPNGSYHQLHEKVTLHKSIKKKKIVQMQ